MKRKKQKTPGLSMHPDKVRQVQELRRSSAAGTIDKKTPRSTERRRAITEQERS